MKPRRSRKWFVLFVVLILVLIAGGVAYRSSKSSAATIGSDSLAEVKRGDIARSVVATGVVEPISNRIEIRSKASGIVKQVRVDVGDKVEPNQVLVELDRDQLIAQQREAEGPRKPICWPPGRSLIGTRSWLRAMTSSWRRPTMSAALSS